MILSQGKVSQEDNITTGREKRKGRRKKEKRVALGGEWAGWRQASIRFDAIMEVEMGEVRVSE